MGSTDRISSHADTCVLEAVCSSGGSSRVCLNEESKDRCTNGCRA